MKKFDIVIVDNYRLGMIKKITKEYIYVQLEGNSGSTPCEKQSVKKYSL